MAAILMQQGGYLVAFGFQLFNADHTITKAFEGQSMVFGVAAKDVGGVQLHCVGASLQHPQSELRFAFVITTLIAPAIGCGGVDEGAAKDGFFGDLLAFAFLGEVVNQKNRHT